MEGKKVEYKDFDFIRTLGKGAYGEVLLAKKKDTQQQLAVKVISKQLLKKEKKQYQILIEKEILGNLDHIGIIKMHYSFQDVNNLYIAVDLCGSGDFSDYLQGNFHKLDQETVQFYAAEMILILEYIHNSGIAHRDLKPENILITQDNHLKFIDFGTALIFNNNMISKESIEKIQNVREKNQQEQIDDVQDPDDTRDRQGTFVGSPLYVSPELLETNICGPEGDLWALGCIIYQMFAKQTPFNDVNQYLIFQKIKEVKYPIPEFMPEEAKDLIQKLLTLNPRQRLGAGPPGSKNDYNALKNHPFFNNFEWKGLFERQAPKRHVTLQRNYVGADDLDMFKLQELKNDSSDDEAPSPAKKTGTLGWGGGDGPIMQGVVLKKVGWMYYKKRNMVLLNNPPKLLYFDSENGNKKGEIILNKNMKIQMNDKSSFTIDGVNKGDKVKKYYFKESQTPANLWVEKIKKCIEEA